MRDMYVNNQNTSWNYGKDKGCENLKEERLLITQAIKEKTCRKEVAFEIFPKQGNSTVKTQPWKVWDVERNKRKKPGEITEGFENCQLFNSKINLTHFG